MKKFGVLCVLSLSLSAFANTGAGAVAAPATGSATGMGAATTPSTGSAGMDSQKGLDNAMDQQRMEDRSKMDNNKTKSKIVSPQGNRGMDSSEAMDDDKEY